MALKLGYLIWDSTNGLACDGVKKPVVCDVNARAGSVVPVTFDGVTGLTWDLYDNVSEWPDNSGARNGVIVNINGTLYLWDVQGDATSDEEANSPYAKLAAFLELCKDCEDCDAEGVSILAGEYNGVYEPVPATTFCYNVTVTSVTDYPTAQDIKEVELNFGNYLHGQVKVVSYNAGTDTAVYRVCLTKSVDSAGYPVGAPSNYSFAAV